jgi:hypothetical protein
MSAQLAQWYIGNAGCTQTFPAQQYPDDEEACVRPMHV